MKVNINSQLKSLLDALSSEYSIEVGGYLTGKIENGEIYLEDLLMPSQTISSVSVNITPAQQVDLIKRVGFEKVRKIIGHWHSHHSMGVGWSPTDITNMDTIMEAKKMFVFVVSSLGNHLVKVCVRDPINFDVNEVDFVLKSKYLDKFRSRVDELIEKNSVGMSEEKIENRMIDLAEKANAEEDDDDEVEPEKNDGYLNGGIDSYVS